MSEPRSIGWVLTMAGLLVCGITPIRTTALAEPVQVHPASVGSPLSNVPLSHPAYPAVTYLEEAGVFTGYPDGTFNGKRPLKRYEFAVAVQRTHWSVQKTIKTLEPREAAPSTLGPPGWSQERERKLIEALRDPERRRRMVAWHEPLLTEFAPELTMLGADLPSMQKAVDQWQQYPPPKPKPEEAAAHRE